jgi:hypothetical protein
MHLVCTFEETCDGAVWPEATRNAATGLSGRGMVGSNGLLHKLWELVGVMKGIKKEIANGFWEIQDLLNKTWDEDDGESEESEESEDGGEEIDEEEVVGMMEDLENIQVENSEPVGPSP